MSHFEGTPVRYDDGYGEDITVLNVLPSFSPDFDDYPQITPNNTNVESYLTTGLLMWVSPLLSTLNVNYMHSDQINGKAEGRVFSLMFEPPEGATHITDVVPKMSPLVYTPSKVDQLFDGPPSGSCGKRTIGNPSSQYYYNMTGTTYYYAGAEAFTPSGDIDLCRVIAILNFQGDMTGKTIYCQIWSKSGNDLDTKLAEDSIAGTSEMGSNVFPYPFFIDYTLLNGVAYAIVITMDEVDASNYPRVWRGPAISTPFGNTAAWNSSGVRQTADGYEPSFILFEKA